MKEEQSFYRDSLTKEIVRFANFLKAHGFKIFQNSIHDALLSLRHINFFNKQDFFSALRINLAKTDLEWSEFKRLFEEFWGGYFKKKKKEEFLSEKKDLLKEADIKAGKDQLIKDELLSDTFIEGTGYSPYSDIEKKEISLFSESDVQTARLAIKRIAEPFKIHKTRRSKRSISGDVFDFPKIMRKSLKYEGIPFELFFKEKKKKLRKLVIVADVSGSMERFAYLVIPFILSVRGTGSKVEVFVFSTSLTRITHIVKHMDMKKAIEKLTEEVPNWAGGTRIGYSLKQLNEWQGGTLIDKRTVIVILSDGWDLGSEELLKKEMKILSSKAHRIIWLNPLLNNPVLKKMCKGMLVALPYIDHALPVNNLESLKKVGKIISKEMVH